MSKRTDIEELFKRVRILEQDIQIKEMNIQNLADEIKRLDSVLVESGILEHNWTPDAPKGSSIKSNYKYFEPTYTKINKVWE